MMNSLFKVFSVFTRHMEINNNTKLGGGDVWQLAKYQVVSQSGLQLSARSIIATGSYLTIEFDINKRFFDHLILISSPYTQL